MNVAGRLAIFPRDPLVEDLEIQDQVPLCSPTLIASNVEFLSLYNSAIPGIARSPYFEDAVWLMCGAFGFKVWLPLPQANEANNEISNDQSSKRSVFVFHPVVYPVAVECNSGFMMGVDSDNSVVATKDIMDILNPPPVAPAKTASEMLGISVASKSVGGTQNSGGQIVANYLVTKTVSTSLRFIPTVQFDNLWVEKNLEVGPLLFCFKNENFESVNLKKLQSGKLERLNWISLKQKLIFGLQLSSAEQFIFSWRCSFLSLLKKCWDAILIHMLSVCCAVLKVFPHLITCSSCFYIMCWKRRRRPMSPLLIPCYLVLWVFSINITGASFWES